MDPDAVLNFLAQRMSEQEEQAETDEIPEHRRHALADAAAKRAIMRKYEWAVDDCKHCPTAGNQMVRHALGHVMRCLAYVHRSHPDWEISWTP